MECFIGSIVLFAGNFNPRNFMLCAGQLMSISQNTALFSILGTNYGGDGRVTFGLPDLRGRAAVGVGTGPRLSEVVLGEQAGVASTTLLLTDIPNHTHASTINVAPVDGAQEMPANTVILAASVEPVNAAAYFTYSTDLTTLIALAPAGISVLPVGNQQAFSVMQPYLGLTYLVCTEGIFPARSRNRRLLERPGVNGSAVKTTALFPN